MKNKTFRQPGVLLLALLLASGGSLLFIVHGHTKGFWTDSDEAGKTGNRPEVKTLPDFAGLAEKLSPAVVSLRVEGRRPGVDEPSAELFRRFFGRELPPATGAGSGFVINEDGYILTNNHVVESADKITVALLGDKREYPAEVIGRDAKTDVGLIKIKVDHPLSVLALGNSDHLRVGEWVMAIGNPLGMDHSVTVGVVSALGREIEIPEHPKEFYADFIQTDASINPGNSGGPLINVHGEVIGINTAIVNPMSAQGIGFAVPVNIVKAVLSQLKDRGSVRRSFLGIEIQEVDAELAESFKMKEPRGALVAKVVPDGPASKAGLVPEDIIMEFDGKAVKGVSELRWLASIAGVGKKVDVTILREGQEQHKSIVLGELPEGKEGTPVRPAAAASSGIAETALGITVAPASEEMRKAMGLGNTGVVITAVKPGSLGQKHGIQPGDVIIKANGRSVREPDKLKKIIGSVPAEGVIRLLIQRRDRSRLFIAFRKP